MQVRVLFFGVLKDVLGRAGETVLLPEGATVGDLVARYEQAEPRLGKWRASLAMSVNQEYARPESRLKNNDEVALLPPVSGGGEGAVVGPGYPRVGMVHEKIDAHSIVPPLERPEDGAIVMFDGIVRNHSRGRKTLYLDYEAYEPMALAEMAKLRAQALEKFAVREAAIVHRLGRLEVGESSVFIAVFSAHRAAAFEACRWIIDTLKKTVPIWKKEYFEDGAVWADGEPFPAEIAKSGAGLRSASPDEPPDATQTR